MKPILIVLACLLFLSSMSQQKKYSFGVEGSAGLGFNSFAYDPMVPMRKQGALCISDDASVTGYFVFSLTKVPLQFKVGGGYSERSFAVRKYSFTDIFLAFIPFFSFRDTSYITEVQIRNCYINIPIGIFYHLTKNKKQGFQASTGIQFTSLFLTSSSAIANFDSTYHIPTQAEKEVIEKKYTQTAASAVYNIQPRLDLRIRIYRGLGIDLNLIPFAFYLNSTNPELMKSSGGFTTSFGIHYDL